MDQQEGFSEGEKTLMCLSLEILEGLHNSGNDKLVEIKVSVGNIS